MAKYNGRTCIAPNCKSGYKSTKNESETRIHFFSVPSGKEVLEKWQRAILRKKFIIRTGQVVCEKHFRPEDILWKREVKDADGKVMSSVDYKIPRLRKGAVPSIFPNCPKYLSKVVKERKAPNERKSVDSDNLRNKHNTGIEEEPMEVEGGEMNKLLLPEPGPSFASEINKLGICDEFPNEPDPTSSNVANVLESDSDRIAFFNSLISKKDSFKLPTGWLRYDIENGEFRAIEFSECTGRWKDGKVTTVHHKKIILYKDMTAHVLIMNCSVDNKVVGIPNSHVSSATELESAMSTLHKLKVCQGCASPSSVHNFKTSFTFCDALGTLRHNNCSLILDSGAKQQAKYCQSCKKGRITLSKKTVRLRRQNDLQRIVLKLSPQRKEKLKLLTQKMNTTYKQKVRLNARRNLLKQNLAKNKEKLNALQKSAIDEELTNKNIPKNEQTVIAEILKAAKSKSAKGRRYSEEWIVLSLLFHMRSPAAYRMLRDSNVLPLPCISTVRRYLALIETPCGFSENLFKVLDEKLKEQPELSRHGILMFDEMGTRKNIRVDPKTMEYKGLANIGDTNIDQIADHALVFVFQSINDTFTQPIAVFTSKGPAVGIELAKLVIQCIILLEKYGARIHGVVCDGSKPNRKFWDEVGCSGNLKDLRNSFAHPLLEESKVFLFSDVPHLIKCLRNRLFKKGELQVDPDTGVIKWEYFVKLFDIDRFNRHGRLCPKLTSNHIHLHELLKMKVSYAVQIFSKSTASALLSYKNYYPELKFCEPTAEFCLIINNLFDSLNRTKCENGLTLENTDFQVLQDSLLWLNNWEQRKIDGSIDKNRFLTDFTSEGLRVTIQSTMDLCKTLIKEFHFSYLLTGRINQDPLERFFGTIRMAGGTNDHPCTPTFLQIFKIVSAISILKPPKTGNCTVFDGNSPQPLMSISKLKELFKTEKISTLEEIKKKLESIIDCDDSDFSDFVDAVEHDYALPEVSQCLIFYTTGRVAAYIKKTTQCETCLSAFLSTNNINEDALIFSINNLPKGFEQFTKSNKHFVHPNVRLFKIISTIDSLFNKYKQSSFALELILNELISSGERFTFNCLKHTDKAVDIIAFIVQYYLQIRMREFVQQKVGSLKRENKLKKKAAKLCSA